MVCLFHNRYNSQILRAFSIQFSFSQSLCRSAFGNKLKKYPLCLIFFASLFFKNIQKSEKSRFLPTFELHTTQMLVEKNNSLDLRYVTFTKKLYPFLQFITISFFSEQSVSSSSSPEKIKLVNSTKRDELAAKPSNPLSFSVY